MKLYTGITIGPIIETMSLTSTPAGLWFSSYFFSTITRDLCKRISCNNNLSILTLPIGYSFEEEIEDKGIGGFHDRIYFVSSNLEKQQVKSFLQDSLEYVISLRAEEIRKALAYQENEKYKINEYLSNYLQIHYVIFTLQEVEKNGIARTLANALDSLELSQNIEADLSKSYIRQIISGTKREGSNYYIKNYEPLIKAVNSGDFSIAYKEQNSVKFYDLYQIACNELAKSDNKNYKWTKLSKYFAIVQADGDSMGKVIAQGNESIEKQEERIHLFSEFCMDYTAKSSDIIKNYGGAVIYAGGDDLLFLAPINGKDKSDNILKLCKRIADNFSYVFSKSSLSSMISNGTSIDSQIKPSISFGVSINYHKFPLYEAFDDARNLLFGFAKNYGEKNNIAVKVHKASGQTSGYICRLQTGCTETIYEKYLSLLDEYYTEESSEKVNLLMHSVVYEIENMKTLFECSLNDTTMIDKVFINVFDNIGQQWSLGFRNAIADLVKKIVMEYDSNVVYAIIDSNFRNHTQELHIQEKDESRIKQKEIFHAVISLLRASKILVED